MTRGLAPRRPSRDRRAGAPERARSIRTPRSRSAAWCKRYGEFVAVDGLDLDIRRGEIFALLGPNGAGKTTTVEICEGYRSRDAGEVRVLGEDPADGARALEGAAGHRAAVRRRRQPADLPRAAARRRRPTTPTRATPTRCSSWSGSPRRPESRGRTLSGGQRRRLDVALGIVGRPDAALPRRADDRLRPGGAAAVLVADPLAARAGHHDAAHHALPGRGRGAGRPGRRHRPRPAGRGRRPGGARRPGDRARRRQLDRGRRPAQRGDRRRRRRSCASWPPGSPARCPTWPSPARRSRTCTCG